MARINVPLELCIEFGPSLQLSDVESHRRELMRPGVYLLTDQILALDVKPENPAIIYIGKAIKETIFSRCQKHLWTIRDAKLSNGKPKTTPGKKFKRYRESIGFDPTKLWIIPGVMNDEFPYLISCAEEYLLFEYLRCNGRLPKANTSGGN